MLLEIFGLKISISGLKISVSGLKISISGLKISISGLKISINSLKISINGLKISISGVKIWISGLKILIFGLKIWISSLNISISGQRNSGPPPKEWCIEFWPPPEGMVPNFEPKNDLKKGQICVFGSFLGPNGPFRLFSHYIQSWSDKSQRFCFLFTFFLAQNEQVNWNNLCLLICPNRRNCLIWWFLLESFNMLILEIINRWRSCH